MIVLTRLNGERIALNPDRVERAESTPDTVITLVDGTKYVVEESIEEISDLLVSFKAAVRVEARRLTSLQAPPPTEEARLRLVNLASMPVSQPAPQPTPLPTENRDDA
ncbi:MAG: flagellar FlbD family protein [Actinomycetota bacterium]|nr:flagellar FlbD family protein [Actinomycetota bacterium]